MADLREQVNAIADRVELISGVRREDNDAAESAADDLRQIASALAAQPAPRALRDLLHFTEHCISAADEGVDYAVPRNWLDAMTAMGIMEKVGRGKWAPTEQAQAVVDSLAAAPQPAAVNHELTADEGASDAH